MAKLPSVLAGPILRRCTEKMVTVWLATSDEFKDALELAVYDAANVKAPKPIAVTTDRQVVKAGARLFVHLLVARPKPTSGVKVPPFPRGRLLGYDVMVLNKAVPEESPMHRTSLTTEKLDYDTYPWPTFFLQADRTPLRVLHGSCRRAYAAGRDAMAAPDTLIKDTLADLNKRPTVMILTGDQIYADDVLWAMWSHTSALATRVSGYDETAPVDGTFKRLATLGNRKGLLLKNGLTTEDGENHLIGFSEYAAHYLLNWSETLWDGYKPALGPMPKNLADAVGLIEVERFRQTLPAVRRGLANVPTYMVFDDHDVTDDWNLDEQFVKETTASPLGTRLITCALYAYWLFQAWGNDPDAFDARFVGRVRAFCALFMDKAGSPAVADTKDFDESIRTKVGPATGFGTRPSWSFVVPCTPPIFVLDTRTSRDLQARGKGPGLLNKAGKDGMKRTIDRARAQGLLDLSTMPLVFVSATPLWPVQFIDLLQRREIVKGGTPQSADLEFWRNNLRAHTNFLLEILQLYDPGSIVVLSGDVHYGFTGHAAIYDGTIDPQADLAGKRRTGGKHVDIYQLTSSAFKNENSKVALSRHGWSNVGSGLLTSIDIDNDWVNYLFAGQSDVSMDGQRFMEALLRLNTADEYMLPQVFWANIANRHGGPLLMPDYLFRNLDLRVERAPIWREEVQLHDHRGSGGAYVTAEAHVGLVTFDSRKLTHDLYGLVDPGQDVPLARLAPKTWGPARVPLRLGR